ncbi:MAG: hypothetical protein ABH863_05410 [Candidatus Micrarchaeota archaeon]
MNRWPLAASFLLLLAFVFISDIRSIIQAPIRLFTEGNTFGKHFVFLLFLFIILLARQAFANNKVIVKRLTSKRRALVSLFSILILGGFIYSLGLQLAFQQQYGLGNDDYAAHVIDCGKATCWEATYLQHTHIPKTAIYSLEKFVGVDLGSLIDDGRPMYGITPFADAFAPITLLLLALIAILALLLGILEKNRFMLILLFLASITSLISILDGGIFTVSGVTAIATLFLYLSRDFNHRFLRRHAPAIAALIAVFLGQFGFWLLGTGLYFRDWFVPPLLVISSFMLFGRPPKHRLLAGALFALSIFLILQAAISDYSGYRVLPGEALLAYGLPMDVSGNEILLAFPMQFSQATKYGWYGRLEPLKETTTRNFEAKFREKFSPKGYMFAEADPNSSSAREITVIWISPRMELSFETASFKQIRISSNGNIDTLVGNSSLNGPHLALEIGSYLHSIGGDAIVISKVI